MLTYTVQYLSGASDEYLWHKGGGLSWQRNRLPGCDLFDTNQTLCLFSLLCTPFEIMKFSVDQD